MSLSEQTPSVSYTPPPQEARVFVEEEEEDSGPKACSACAESSDRVDWKHYVKIPGQPGSPPADVPKGDSCLRCVNEHEKLCPEMPWEAFSK